MIGTGENLVLEGHCSFQEVGPDAPVLHLHFPPLPAPSPPGELGGWLFRLIFCLPDRGLQEQEGLNQKHLWDWRV